MCCLPFLSYTGQLPQFPDDLSISFCKLLVHKININYKYLPSLLQFSEKFILTFRRVRIPQGPSIQASQTNCQGENSHASKGFQTHQSTHNTAIFLNYLKSSSIFKKSGKMINDKTMETDEFHLVELFLSFESTSGCNFSSST